MNVGGEVKVFGSGVSFNLEKPNSTGMKSMRKAQRKLQETDLKDEGGFEYLKQGIRVSDEIFFKEHFTHPSSTTW